MFKKISWRRLVPVIGVSLLAAGLFSFAGTQQTSAHNRSNWDRDTKFYLKLDGVAGSANSTGHKGEISLNSYRFMEDENDADSQSQATQLNGLGDNNLRFLADTSKASPVLFTKAQNGETIANGVLSVRKGNSDSDFLTFKMTDIVVSSFQNNANDDDDPTDEVVLKYATVQVTYNDGGQVKAGWDFMKKQQLK